MMNNLLLCPSENLISAKINDSLINSIRMANNIATPKHRVVSKCCPAENVLSP